MNLIPVAGWQACHQEGYLVTYVVSTDKSRAYGHLLHRFLAHGDFDIRRRAFSIDVDHFHEWGHVDRGVGGRQALREVDKPAYTTGKKKVVDE